MSSTMAAVVEAASKVQPGTSSDIAAELGEREANNISAILSNAEKAGYVRRAGVMHPENGGKPRPMWEVTGKQPGESRKAPGARTPRVKREPVQVSFDDLRAVLGAEQARDVLKMIELAKVKPIMISDEQIAMGHGLMNGGPAPSRPKLLIPLFQKFFAENQASKRTFAAWLDALAVPQGEM